MENRDFVEKSYPSLVVHVEKALKKPLTPQQEEVLRKGISDTYEVYEVNKDLIAPDIEFSEIITALQELQKNCQNILTFRCIDSDQRLDDLFKDAYQEVNEQETLPYSQYIDLIKRLQEVAHHTNLVLEQSLQKKNKPGPNREPYGVIVEYLAKAWKEVTGKFPTVTEDKDTGQKGGKFTEFVNSFLKQCDLRQPLSGSTIQNYLKTIKKYRLKFSQ